MLGVLELPYDLLYRPNLEYCLPSSSGSLPPSGEADWSTFPRLLPPLAATPPATTAACCTTALGTTATTVVLWTCNTTTACTVHHCFQTGQFLTVLFQFQLHCIALFLELFVVGQ